MCFTFFDPHQPVAISRRNLPHWEQSAVTYFVTFRTADSLPAHIVRAWKDQRDEWLKRHGLDPRMKGWREALEQLPGKELDEFHSVFTARFHEYLDAGHGACVLKRRELNTLVAESLMFFGGTRYALGDFVVMPNHVHVLVQPSGSHRLKAICRSWKKFTATAINKQLSQAGTFWQQENYDHIVRSEAQFSHYQRYIAENPKKAGLKEGEYYLHQLPDSAWDGTPPK
jgi:REP element-mobilizing transposase RayT